jgi:hypothetical protein
MRVLVLPSGAGQPIPGEAVARRGAGLVARMPKLDIALLDRSLTDETPAEAAREAAVRDAALPASRNTYGGAAHGA